MASVPSGQHPFVVQFIHYLSSEKNASPHTCRCYQNDLEEFETFLKKSEMYLSPSGDIEMGKVDRIGLRKYLSFLHRRNKKSSIARKVWRCDIAFSVRFRQSRINSPKNGKPTFPFTLKYFSPSWLTRNRWSPPKARATSIYFRISM